jgi:hypothetical protein
MQDQSVMTRAENDAVVGGHRKYGTGKRIWDLGFGVGGRDCPQRSARSGQALIRTHINAKMGELKTTVEIPDGLFREAKAAAAQKGISLKQLFTEALREQLRRRTAGEAPDKPWMQAFGGLRQLHKENKRLERIIATEFEGIDEEEWR